MTTSEVASLLYRMINPFWDNEGAVPYVIPAVCLLLVAIYLYFKGIDLAKRIVRKV
jgi:hypothetical protein